MTPSCDDCWSRAKQTDNPIATYRRLLAEHDDNQPVLEHEGVRVYQADCLALLRTMPDESVHAIVTDPPYGLADHKPAAIVTALTAWANGDRASVPSGKGGFMGRKWDAFVPPPAVWDECLRVLKPGGHMLVFSGTRTVDLMGLSVRLAGFDIRDSIQWLTGSGFPKSLDVSKAIESKSGRPEDIRRMAMGENYEPSGRGRVNYDNGGGSQMNGATKWSPSTDAARQWSGWGTALKPASEPIIVARKPLGEKTVAANVQAHGTGAVNIDGCRVRPSGQKDEAAYRAKCASVVGLDSNRNGDAYGKWTGQREDSASDQGRWPSNVVLDEHAAAELDAQSGSRKSGGAILGTEPSRDGEADKSGYRMRRVPVEAYGDVGGASRFFPVFKYQAKAPSKERPKVWVPSRLRLRADLSDDQRAYVLAELTKAGVDVS